MLLACSRADSGLFRRSRILFILRSSNISAWSPRPGASAVSSLSSERSKLNSGMRICRRQFRKKSHFLRILQEALQNAVKHSAEQNCTVEVHGTKEGISLTVNHSGVGCDWQDAMNRRGLGLISMRERLRLVDGELSLRSAPGRGTTVLARVSLGGTEFSVGIAG